MVQKKAKLVEKGVSHTFHISNIKHMTYSFPDSHIYNPASDYDLASIY